MKITNTILLLLWMIFTIILTCSIIGLLIIASGMDSGTKSTWMTIGTKLINDITS